MKGRKGLQLSKLDISLINNNESTSQNKKSFSSPMGTTYREMGLSIGRDYMRFEGHVRSSSLSPKDLIIEEIIGRGACSIVKRARHSCTQEPYALKLFPIRDEHRREMLVKELRAMCSLKYECDCLVGLIGAFYDKMDGSVSIALEYMDRGSLRDFLRKHLHDWDEFHNSNNQVTHSYIKSKQGGLPEVIISSIAHQIIWGLGYLHFENMIHRDVKPENVLINSAGQIKLSDFGLASKHLKGETQLNQTVVGTSRYMSPERLRAKSYSFASDIWSLGLILFECSTGKYPFEEISSFIELVETIEELTAEDFVPKTIEKDFREILLGCLQECPEKRIPSSILMSSPWFSSHEIHDITDASLVMRLFIEKMMPPQKPEHLGFSTISAMKDSKLGMGIYSEYFCEY